VRTFAQRHNQPSTAASAGLAWPNKATLRPAHRGHSLLPLQGTIGSQAVLRLFQTPAEELNAGFSSTTASRFEHDFARIAEKRCQPPRNEGASRPGRFRRRCPAPRWERVLGEGASHFAEKR
jgi:hypothetical protein